MKARLKRLQINPEAFIHIMSEETAWRVSKGLPKGCRLRGAVMDPYAQNLIILLEHESFDEVEVTEVAPLIETEFRRIV